MIGKIGLAILGAAIITAAPGFAADAVPAIPADAPAWQAWFAPQVKAQVPVPGWIARQ